MLDLQQLLTRLRRLDEAAGLAAQRMLKPALLLAVLAILVLPVMMMGPTGLLEWLVDLGFAMNADGARSWGEDLEVNVGAEPPAGCDPADVQAFDMPGSGTVYSGPRAGC
jgi:hypothetical protein